MGSPASGGCLSHWRRVLDDCSSAGHSGVCQLLRHVAAVCDFSEFGAGESGDQRGLAAGGVGGVCSGYGGDAADGNAGGGAGTGGGRRNVVVVDGFSLVGLSNYKAAR